MPLWENGAPGAKAYRAQPERPVTGHEADGWIENVNDPSLTVYLPAEGKATGSAIVVAPGGGHRFLAADHEGQAVGRWLAEHGIVGAVLKYRLYRQVGSPYRRGDAIADGERAVRVVRSHADEWHVRPDRIGFMGFSAGGDLTLAVGRESDAGDAAADDPIERASSRPDFQVPIYPGGVKDAIPQVTPDTMPTLLIAPSTIATTSRRGCPNYTWQCGRPAFPSSFTSTAAAATASASGPAPRPSIIGPNASSSGCTILASSIDNQTGG